jgi:hypothetical protein
VRIELLRTTLVRDPLHWIDLQTESDKHRPTQDGQYSLKKSSNRRTKNTALAGGVLF